MPDDTAAQQPAMRQQPNRVPGRLGLWFDVVFGIVAPVLCLYFDPLVFRDWSYSSGLCLPVLGLKQYAPFAYLAIGLGAALLAAWLIAGERLAHWAGLLAGVFFVGAGLAAFLGFVLLPISLPMLIALCSGSLGLIPFVTAFVYLRHAWRTFRYAPEAQSPVQWARLGALFLTGVVLVLTIPGVVQWQVAGLAPREPLYRIVECPSV
jgi:hypothetical protein